MGTLAYAARGEDDGQALQRAFRHLLAVLAVAALAAGCECEPSSRGAPAQSQSGPANELPVVETTEPAPSPATEETQEAPPQIGYAALPTEPTDAELARVRAALAVHGRGDYEASEAAFRAVVEESPGYLDARYDLACALARLDRVDEARVLVESMLALDYPSIAPRLDADEDLAALRDNTHLVALRARLERAYRDALRDGVEVSRVVDRQLTVRRSRRTVQAGVWLASSRRFVPMGRSFTRQGHHEEGGDWYPVVSTVALDRELGVVVALLGRSGNRPFDDVLTRVELVAAEIGTGRPLGTARLRCPDDECRNLHAHALRGGAVASTAEYDAAPVETRAGEVDGGYDADHRPSLSCGENGCFVAGDPLPETVRLDRRSVTLRWDDGSVTTITLEREHRNDTGRIPMRLGPDGSVYVQLGEHVERHVPGSRDPLPEGLRIDPGPHSLEIID